MRRRPPRNGGKRTGGRHCVDFCCARSAAPTLRAFPSSYFSIATLGPPPRLRPPQERGRHPAVRDGAVRDGGDAQQGKSRITAAVSAMFAAADDEIAAAVQERLGFAEPPAGLAAEVGESKKLRHVTVKTIGMQDFTPAELFARCSGDWGQIEDRFGRNAGRAKGRRAPERPPFCPPPLSAPARKC